jgi:hypothetical protein
MGAGEGPAGRAPTFIVDTDCRAMDNRRMFRRGSLVSAVLAPLMVGLVGLLHLMNQPRFGAIRTVDVVQLTGSGMCFGVALAALIALIRMPKE